MTTTRATGDQGDEGDGDQGDKDGGGVDEGEGDDDDGTPGKNEVRNPPSLSFYLLN